MRQIRTISALQGALDDELAWRLRDLHGLKKAISSTDQTVRNSALRAFMAMLYAHWEGFVRGAALSYAAYLSKQDLRYSDVLDCFRGLETIRYVRESEKLGPRMFAPNALLKQLRQIDGEQLHLPLEKYISKVGNLNHALFVDIAGLLGFCVEPYETKRALIDEGLLKQRNDIAHGQYLLVNWDDADNLGVEIIGLMRGFKTDIENAATSKSYLRPLP